MPGLSTRLDNGEDIAKPAGVRCKYLTAAGCGIYEVRPGVCRRFECDFKRGMKGFDKHPFELGYFGKDRHLFVLKHRTFD